MSSLSLCSCVRAILSDKKLEIGSRKTRCLKTGLILAIKFPISPTMHVLWPTLFCFFAPLISKCCAAATAPSPVFLMTPPINDQATHSATARPHHHQMEAHESSAEQRYVASWNSTNSLRDKQLTSTELLHDSELYIGSSSEKQREREDPSDNDLIEHPKQLYPPVSGAGYVPPAAVLEQSAPVVLGFQHERDVPRVEYVTADCFSNYMKISVQFNGSFDGLVYSTGYSHDAECVYVNGSGHDRYEFNIRLNRCGTLGRPEFEPTSNEVPDRNHFMWNTITVQYNSEIEEDWDEHFQVTCEYGYEFRRTVTFPVVGVEKNTASPYLVTLSPPQCYMEVRAGFGPSGNHLTGPVTVGDPLTLMIHMESDSTEFDVAVSSCYAHNGAKKKIQLIDANGCILKEQLMSPFRGVRSAGGTNHVALYAYFKAFRFTSSPALYLECDVHMCHGTCPAQRCHWKSLTKRSADRHLDSGNSSLTSENVSLFQALQVLQESPDSQGSGKVKAAEMPSSTLCLPVLGLTAVTTAFLACLMLSTVVCILLCIRMRRLKEVGSVSDLGPYMTYGHGQPGRKRM
ncbi:hypothetical protein JTE90_008809 [Oedothorax gibbosus]|uniref:ZP domain-containing protein n=1 Tax=Oedothorax gibbosus TaxID=931172 RepID=A0AAV6V7Z0_9ARAC|nr:hypothetical protein JTE90_008809 [Oedothorax gibbosus]